MGYVTNVLRLLLRYVTLLTLLIAVSGCSGPWRVYLLYDRPQRPIEEVAVLIGRSEIWIKQIDKDNNVGSEYFYTEVHLQPGWHSITIKFTERVAVTTPWEEVYISGGPVSIRRYFDKGHVYLLSSECLNTDRNEWVDCKDVSVWGMYSYSPYSQWRVKVADLGNDYRRIASNLSRTEWDGVYLLTRSSQHPPAHWRELAATKPGSEAEQNCYKEHFAAGQHPQ